MQRHITIETILFLIGSKISFKALSAAAFKLSNEFCLIIILMFLNLNKFFKNNKKKRLKLTILIKMIMKLILMMIIEVMIMKIAYILI